MTYLGDVCCVLGGAGFIGQALVRKLCQTGRMVRVVDIKPPPQRLPEGASYVRINLLEASSLNKIFSGASEVIDLVYNSVPNTSFEDPLADIQNNLPRTVSIMEGLLRSNVSRFIYVSSGGTVYGEGSTLPITEKCSTSPISPYGVTKLASERYADLYRACYGVPSIITRPSNAYGEHQPRDSGQGFIAHAINCCLSGLPINIFGERGTLRDYIHVEDLTNALVAILENGVVGETYNISTGVATDNMQILNLVSKMARRSGIDEPQIAIKPRRPFDVRINVLDSTKLTVVSGWQPEIFLSDGIQRCWDYMLHIHRNGFPSKPPYAHDNK